MYQRILVPIDGSNVSRLGVERAIEMGRMTGARIRIVHALDELDLASGFERGVTYFRDVLPRRRREAERLVADARPQVVAAGIAADSVVMDCFACRTADVVLEAARSWQADLIVIGTHGRRGPSRWFIGSHAEDVVRGATVPVLLIRGGEATAPPPHPERVAEPA